MADTLIIVSIVGIALLASLFPKPQSSNDASANYTGKRRAAMATCITVGAALGAALGAATDNIGMGVAIGVAVGVAIGVARETRQS